MNETNNITQNNKTDNLNNVNEYNFVIIYFIFIFNILIFYFINKLKSFFNININNLNDRFNLYNKLFNNYLNTDNIINKKWDLIKKRNSLEVLNLSKNNISNDSNKKTPSLNNII